MLYSHPQRPAHTVANIVGAVAVGLFFALVGLNAASGCGETHGQCLGVQDFIGHAPQLAAR